MLHFFDSPFDLTENIKEHS